MTIGWRGVGFIWAGLGVASFLLGGPVRVEGQDRLKTMPGYARYDSVRKSTSGAVKSGAVTGTWVDDGKAFDFRRDGKSLRFDVTTKQVGDPPAASKGEATGGRGLGGVPGRSARPQGVGRGRQADSAMSPDKTLKVTYRDRNLYVSDPNGVVELAITTDGSAAKRTKNGKASWVYGEELYQPTAFWWSPDSKKLAYYRFDESPVTDYYLQLDQTEIQDKLDVEAYPKAGTPNPVVELFVHDLKSKKTVAIDVRDGKPFEDEVVGHYVYNVRWSPDGKELLFYRTNRHQNILELVAADPDYGQVPRSGPRGVAGKLGREQPRISVSSRMGTTSFGPRSGTGFKNYLVCRPRGRLASGFDEERVRRRARSSGSTRLTGVVDYLAHDGDNAMKLQLHRVKLDGSGDRRLTDPRFQHTINIPRGQANFIDVAPDGKTLYRHRADPRPAAQPPALMVAETGEVLATLGRERHDPVRCPGAEAGRAVHLQGRRWQDRLARPLAQTVELRLERQEVPLADFRSTVAQKPMGLQRDRLSHPGRSCEMSRKACSPSSGFCW